MSSSPLDGFNFVKLMPLAVFAAVAIVAWLVIEIMGGRKSRTSERLDELRNPNSRRREEGGKGKKGDTMAKMFEMASPALAKPLKPKNEIDANKIKAKLSAAGFRNDSASSAFLGCKFIGLVIGLVVFGGTMLAVSGTSQKTLVYTIFGAAMMFYLPDMVVGFIGGRRKKSIFFSLPDVLDLMVVCVEAGLGLDQAMRKVCEEMKKSSPIITEEFSLSNFQLQMGRQRSEVLHELGQRTGVDDLRSLAAILIQADKFGSSVAQSTPRAKRLDAHPPPPIGRGKSGQDRRQTDLPVGDLHLSGHFRGARRSGRDHDDQPDVPGDGRALRQGSGFGVRGSAISTPARRWCGEFAGCADCDAFDKSAQVAPRCGPIGDQDAALRSRRKAARSNGIPAHMPRREKGVSACSNDLPPFVVC